MARGRDENRYVTNVLVSFVASYRATLEFFTKREAAMAEFYPEPFPHWARGDRHFNLVSKDTRRVIRFEPNKFVVRAEGHSSMKPYDDLIAMASKIFEEFQAKDLFAASLTLVRVHEQPTRKDARTKFVQRFLADRAHEILPLDGDTDYGVTFTRETKVNSELVDVKPAMAPLKRKTEIATGPTDSQELESRYCEFSRNADNEMYRTEHVAPDFGILVSTRVTLERHKAKNGVPAPLLWKFHDWARAEVEAQWDTFARIIA